jgi:toxin ParE1/3/4
MAHYRLTRKADNDLAAHYEYGIETFGLAQAQDYLIGLHDRFITLAQTPTLGRSAEELATGLKRFEYGSHVIFYLPNDEGILIVRVLRQEMDFKRHL